MSLTTHRRFAALLVVLAAAALTGCATTTRLDGQWSNPQFESTRITGKVLVVGLTRDETVRRLYEDDMAAQLAARGLSVVRSYEVIPGPLSANSGAQVLAEARHIGAADILSSALVSRQRVQRVYVEPTPAWWGWGYDGWYGHYWPYAMTPTEVRDYDRYVVGTSLTDVKSGKIFWTARTVTESPDTIVREIKGFVKVIVDAMAKANLA